MRIENHRLAGSALQGAAGSGFVVALEERYDICSHCGQLLDFGASLTQEV